jgi:hypothetical protein
VRKIEFNPFYSFGLGKLREVCLKRKICRFSQKYVKSRFLGALRPQGPEPDEASGCGNEARERLLSASTADGRDATDIVSGSTE